LGVRRITPSKTRKPSLGEGKEKDMFKHGPHYCVLVASEGAKSEKRVPGEKRKKGTWRTFTTLGENIQITG